MYWNALAMAGVGTLIIFGLLYATIAIITWSIVYDRNKHLPGPKPTPILGHIGYLQQAGGFHQLLKLWGAQYDKFNIYIGIRTWFMVQDPELIQVAALKLSKDMPHRGPFYYQPHNIGAYGREFQGASQVLFSSIDNSWKSVRASMYSLFQQESLVQIIPQLLAGSKRVAENLLVEGEGGQEVNVHAFMGRASLRNILILATGIDVDSDQGKQSSANGKSIPTSVDGNGKSGKHDEKKQWQNKVNEFFTCVQNFTDAPVFSFLATQLMAFMPFWLQPYISVIPFHLAASFPSEEQKLYKSRQYVVNTMMEQVSRVRRQQGLPITYKGSDYLSLGDPTEGCMLWTLAKAKNRASNQNFDDLAIAYHGYSFILAGQDTTQTSTAFTLYFLAKYPEHQERCAKECALLDENSIASLEQVQAALPYTYACFNETLRILPPAFLTSRQALKDLQVGPYKIPKGSNLGFNIMGMHHNPKYFPQPESYRPERFLPGPEMDNRHPWAFMPFGIGHRDCIGKNFAKLSILLLLSQILKHVKLAMDDSRLDSQVPLNAGAITLCPLQGIWLKTSRRV